MAALRAGSTAVDIDLTRNDSGSSNRPATEPKSAITSTAASTWYFAACQRL